MKKAIVLGAGFAGLSAAAELADRGFQVTVFEQSGRLGGRASSFKEEKTGLVIDNGQHLFMGCYVSTLRFLKKIGSLSLLQFQDNLSVDFIAPGAKVHALQSGRWPAPLHLFSGVIGLGTLSWFDKLKMARVYQAVKNDPTAGAGLTVEQWLKSLGQSERARRYFWDLITIAALNEQSSIAEAGALAVVLQEAFFGAPEKSRLAISKVGLSELCGTPTEMYLAARGGKIEKNSLASKINISDGAVRSIELRDGSVHTADVYVSALPYFALPKLLPAYPAPDPFFAPMRNLSSSPIFSITLWFDREVMDQPFAALIDTQVQWVFCKRRITGEEKYKGMVACVISGARDYLGTTNDDLISMALREMKECFPRAREAKLVHSLIQREKNATLSPQVGYDRHRLPQKTPLSNFFLCGDWTDTGYPATIESAVLSGEKAAALAAAAPASFANEGAIKL